MYKPSLYEIRFFLFFIFFIFFLARGLSQSLPLLLGNPPRATPIDTLLNIRKFYSLMERPCKLNFIDWLLNWEEYFDYLEICDEERVWFAFNKLDGEVEEWWEDIKNDSKHFFIPGHEQILSLPRWILWDSISSHQLKAYWLSLYNAKLTFLSWGISIY